MSEVIGVTSHGPTVRIRPGRSTAWWGMASMIATEGMLFLLLLFTYFYFRAQQGPWPPADLPMPALLSSGIRSAILLASSGTMVLAERAVEKRGDAGRSAAWLAVTLALAAVFLIGHVQEQFRFVDELSPTLTAYGSVMMTILNFHAAHLVVGMLILLFVLVQVLRRRATAQRPTILTVGGMYWHFVDVIWVFVYSSLYLSPHLLGN